MIDPSRGDVGERKSEAGVAEALAGGAEQAGLVGEQVEALEEAAFDAGGDAAVGLARLTPRAAITCSMATMPWRPMKATSWRSRPRPTGISSACKARWT
ncbi:MAG: hypothetical protein WB507_07990 [Solirubrobacterales bacterium]